MNATWIVSANATRARFFSQDGNTQPLEEVNDMVNEAGRARTQDTETDKIGPTSGTKSMHNTGGSVPNKLYEPAQTPEQHSAELFARDIADFLLQAHREGRFQHLSLVVSPKFLGTLRQLLSSELESVVSLEINKDYTQFSPEQLLQQIRTHMEKS